MPCSVDKINLMPRQQRVLAEQDAAVAIKLKSNPGQWYAVQSGGLDRRHTFAQVAYRIREGKQKAFRCTAGTFEATVHTDLKADGDPAELRARYVPTSPVEDAPSSSLVATGTSVPESTT